MKGQAALDWAQANHINLKFKAPRQRAWIVERHHEILRRGLHTTEDMILKEGLLVTFIQVLAIVTFMKNALTVINGSTPYHALIGQQPALFPSLEGGTTEEVGAEPPLVEAKLHCRHNARVREIAATNMIEAISAERIKRATEHNTRPDLRITAY